MTKEKEKVLFGGIEIELSGDAEIDKMIVEVLKQSDKIDVEADEAWIAARVTFEETKDGFHLKVATDALKVKQKSVDQRLKLIQELLRYKREEKKIELKREMNTDQESGFDLSNLAKTGDGKNTGQRQPH